MAATHLMSDAWSTFAAVGQSFAAHDTVQHAKREYARGTVHANSVEGFNSRVRRTVAGVFHHISPEHADLYFHEMGFRWSQRVVAGQTTRRSPVDGSTFEPSGTASRLLCNSLRSSEPPSAANSAEPATAASRSNRQSLRFAYKRDVRELLRQRTTSSGNGRGCVKTRCGLLLAAG
ncbi:MAG: transposase [Rhodospirillales bacterium]|nr:transposase [Rhodospirillales bacterium]